MVTVVSSPEVEWVDPSFTVLPWTVVSSLQEDWGVYL
jgi:hypothetical protein